MGGFGGGGVGEQVEHSSRSFVKFRRVSEFPSQIEKHHGTLLLRKRSHPEALTDRAGRYKGGGPSLPDATETGQVGLAVSMTEAPSSIQPQDPGPFRSGGGTVEAVVCSEHTVFGREGVGQKVTERDRDEHPQLAEIQTLLTDRAGRNPPSEDEGKAETVLYREAPKHPDPGRGGAAGLYLVEDLLHNVTT